MSRQKQIVHWGSAKQLTNTENRPGQKQKSILIAKAKGLRQKQISYFTAIYHVTKANSFVAKANHLRVAQKQQLVSRLPLDPFRRTGCKIARHCWILGNVLNSTRAAYQHLRWFETVFYFPLQLNFMKGLLICSKRLLLVVDSRCCNNLSTYKLLYSHWHFGCHGNLTGPQIHPISSVQLHFTQKVVDKLPFLLHQNCLHIKEHFLRKFKKILSRGFGATLILQNIVTLEVYFIYLPIKRTYITQRGWQKKFKVMLNTKILGRLILKPFSLLPPLILNFWPRCS